MNIHGSTKGTPLEQDVARMAAAEATGGGTYPALARIARDFGLEDAAAQLVEIGNQETNHAGFYATLNGTWPHDPDAFWRLVARVAEAERQGEKHVGDIARRLDGMGLPEAAAEARRYAAEEKRHGEIAAALIAKHAPHLLAENQGKESGP